MGGTRIGIMPGTSPHNVGRVLKEEEVPLTPAPARPPPAREIVVLPPLLPAAPALDYLL